MALAQLKAHVERTAKQRVSIQKQVAELGRKRDAFVVAERKRLAGDGEKLFEEAILESVRAQAAARGFTRRLQPKPAPAKAEVVEAKPAKL